MKKLFPIFFTAALTLTACDDKKGGNGGPFNPGSNDRNGQPQDSQDSAKPDEVSNDEDSTDPQEFYLSDALYEMIGEWTYNDGLDNCQRVLTPSGNVLRYQRHELKVEAARVIFTTSVFGDQDRLCNFSVEVNRAVLDLQMQFNPKLERETDRQYKPVWGLAKVAEIRGTLFERELGTLKDLTYGLTFNIDGTVHLQIPALRMKGWFTRSN